MKFSQPAADIFVPEGIDIEEALKRTTHLCFAAHQDDIEIMAYPGISECHRRRDRWFTGVVVTDGSGSSRTGPFAKLSDEEMKIVRREEQKQAAQIGRYSAVLQLAHPSAVVKKPRAPAVRADLAAIMAVASPRVVYLHNPADKHDTHVAVFLRSVETLRALPRSRRPKQVYGCEVWRDLDWLLDGDKQALDASANPKLAKDLLAVFRSQISGGKRYDLAVAGRRLAHATFFLPRVPDQAKALVWAVDLTPLVQNERLSVEKYVLGHVDRLHEDVRKRLNKFARLK